MAFPWETHKAEYSGIVLMNWLSKPKETIRLPSSEQTGPGGDEEALYCFFYL